MNDGVARVPGRKQHLDIGSTTPDLFGEFGAVDFGHDDVREQQRDLRMRFDQPHGSYCAVRLEHAVSELRQSIDAELPHGRFILHDEDHLLLFAER